MANRTATLVWLCKTEKGWKRYPVIMAKNGRIRTGFVRVGMIERHYPEGRFQVRSFSGTKTVYENAGTEPFEAIAKRDRLARRMDVLNRATEEGIEIVPEEGRILFRKAAEKFLKRCRDLGHLEAAKSYNVAYREFMQFVPKVRYIDQVDEDALIQFQGELRKKGNESRTVANKHRDITGLLRYSGVDVKALKIAKPKYDKKKPRIYTDTQMEGLIAAAAEMDPYMSIVIDVLRMVGLRDAEGVHLQWIDINYDRKLVHVCSKPEYNHWIKDREERDVPLPNRLAERLRERQVTHGRGKLVLGNKRDAPEKKWLRKLKVLARKAGLNCGHCESCLNRRECQRYTLHSFRRSYATHLHRKGVDVRTLMEWMGHSDMETILAYLAPVEAEEAHEQVHAAFA